MNKRQRKKQLKKKLGAEGYKAAERQAEAILTAYAHELGESTIAWAEDVMKKGQA